MELLRHAVAGHLGVGLDSAGWGRDLGQGFWGRDFEGKVKLYLRKQGAELAQ
jgi:hypothetical protein